MGSGVFIFNLKKEEKSWEEEHNTLLVAFVCGGGIKW